MNHTLIVFLLCLSYSFFKILPLKGVYWCVFLIKAVMDWRESRTCTSHMIFSKTTTTKKKR